MSGQVPSIDMSMTNSLLSGGSPKGVYTFFLLACAKNYFEVMRENSTDFNIEGATVALIAFCPNRAKREELWDFYTQHKTDTKNTVYSSSRAVGELISYLSEVLEFEEQAYAGLL